MSGKQLPSPVRRRAYWRRNRLLIGVLLGLWFLVTFAAAWFAADLNRIGLVGPLGFYLGAQGAPIIYLIIIGVYARVMNRADREAHDD